MMMKVMMVILMGVIEIRRITSSKLLTSLTQSSDKDGMFSNHDRHRWELHKWERIHLLASLQADIQTAHSGAKNSNQNF